METWEKAALCFESFLSLLVKISETFVLGPCVREWDSLNFPAQNDYRLKLCVLTVLDTPIIHFLLPNQTLYSDLCYQFHMN